ncbi:MAG: hypothetical protein DCC75_10130 [Proteobacteria bacterium]|nr:MAG: hypothetical protein DCC75_10130 [Pseudomonadota bacterium]
MKGINTAAALSMTPKGSFFGRPDGIRLVNAANYPAAIQLYLLSEMDLLLKLRPAFELLVEVGCMHGRFLEWALSNNKDYLGLDVVPELVLQAQERLPRDLERRGDVRVLMHNIEEPGAAETINSLIGDSRALIFFPFNSFGNMHQHACALDNLRQIGQSVFISTYDTSLEAQAARTEYYSRCNYTNLTVERSCLGVSFRSDEGLDSLALHPHALHDMAGEMGLALCPVKLGMVGLGFVSQDLLISKDSA